MTNQTTINKLIEMRLTALADAFRNQTNDPKMKDIPFDDRLGMLVDIEYTSRKNNRLRRLIRKAEFEQSDASIMDINYTSGRKLNKSLIQRRASCEYILLPEIFYHRRNRQRKELFGLCFRDGSM